MDGNSRKRASKWDLIDGQGTFEDNGRENVRSGSYRAASNEYRSCSGCHSSAHATESDPKYPTHSVRDNASEDRGNWRDNNLDRRNRGFSGAVTNWDEDGSRRDHSRSPRSCWKKPLRSTSRGRSRSRSRSRSPVRGYRHESGVDERPRRKPDVPIQTCRDFTSRRCRRGSRCPYRHPSTQNTEDRRYDFEHREESIRGGKYSHYDAANGDYNGYTRDTLEAKEYDRNSRGTSYNHGAEREPRWSSEIPCSFFAAGNCRNGRFCRFSHQILLSSSSVGRSHGWRGRTNHSPEETGQIGQVTKFSDSGDPHAAEHAREGKQPTKHSPDKGVKNSEAADPYVEYGKEGYGNVVTSQSRNKVVSSSMNDGWGNNSEATYVSQGGPATMVKLVGVEDNRFSNRKNGNSGKISSTSDLKGVDNWIEDKMSPEWNPKVSSSRAVAKEEPPYTVQTLESVNQNVPSQASQLLQYVSSAMPDVVEKPNLQQRYDAPGAFSYDRNVGSDAAREFNSSFPSDKSAQPSIQNVTYGAPGNLNAVGPLSDLSASLVQLLGKGQELPQLYAAMNPTDPVSSVKISNGLHFPGVTIQQYPSIAPGKLYEHQNTGQIEPNTSITPSLHPPNPGTLGTSEVVKREITSTEQNTGEAFNNGYGEGNFSHKPDIDSNPNKKPQTILEETTKGKDEYAKSREGSPLENMDGEGNVGRGKKVKDTKALRDFKHALVNLVKDLLKPAWKDGKIDKEGYKTIVKKAVDKVTSTIQEANIPQTPEKVEQYLSASKPKLTKLVKAYVDKNQKKQT